MAENVSSSCTSRVCVAQNILQNFVSLSIIYIVVKFQAFLTITKRARPLNVTSDLEPAQVKVIHQGQIF